MNFIKEFILIFILGICTAFIEDYNKTIDYGKMIETPNETITFENISNNYKINNKLNKYLLKD